MSRGGRQWLRLDANIPLHVNPKLPQHEHCHRGGGRCANFRRPVVRWFTWAMVSIHRGTGIQLWGQRRVRARAERDHSQVLMRDAKAAWARFCACTRVLPADEAQPLWRLIAAEATTHVS
jgi:hypothetical protein